MKQKRKHKSIQQLTSLLNFFYYATLIMLFISIIVTIAIPFLPDTAIKFEQGIREWFYSVDLPIGIGGGAFTMRSSIPSTILSIQRIKMINVNAAIIINSLIGTILLIVLVNRGLKKLIDLTSNMLKGESPFQLKYIKALRKFSFVVAIYSTLSYALQGLLVSIFATNFFNITLTFMWSGLFFALLGYIVSEIAEHGLFLQNEYDTTL